MLIVSPPLTFPCCHDDKMATYDRKLQQVCTSHGNATSMQHHKMLQLCESYDNDAASQTVRTVYFVWYTLLFHEVSLLCSNTASLGITESHL